MATGTQPNPPIPDPGQDVYRWFKANGWGNVALQHIRTWDKESPHGWQALGYTGEGAPYLLACVRGPIEGIIEEMIALENRWPAWTRKAKAETMRGVRP